MTGVRPCTDGTYHLNAVSPTNAVLSRLRKHMECPSCHQNISREARQCRWCHAAVPVSQHLLEDCGIVPSSRSQATAASRDSQSLNLATLGDRCVAVLLDSAVLLEITVTCDLWLFLRWGRPAQTSLELTAATLLAAAILDALLFFAYMWLFEAAFGATLGKAIVGIGVQNQSRRNALTTSAIRNAFRLIDGIGFYLVGTLVASCSRTRRRLGDICADTLVVAKTFRAPTKAVAASLWVGLFAASMWLVPRIAAHSSTGQPPRYLSQTVVQIGRSANYAFVRVVSLRVEVRVGSASTAEPVALPQVFAERSASVAERR